MGDSTLDISFGLLGLTEAGLMIWFLVGTNAGRTLPGFAKLMIWLKPIGVPLLCGLYFLGAPLASDHFLVLLAVLWGGHWVVLLGMAVLLATGRWKA